MPTPQKAPQPPKYRPDAGWRLDRIPAQRVQRVEHDGDPDRIFLPLMVMLNGKMRGDSGVWMSPAEAEQLHAELCNVLGGDWETLPTCRIRPDHQYAGRR
ncbi:hypothetical protein GCM10010329_50050 [Streptomyces spiroverticillatus]|uniref:Uncharacterized protein n=1 Tax=Streptomyces finlayi TaxID=67296 RepID=A0A918X1L5_9ACTN|nr:hypothetical protein [Streptomyces finlayi]GHA20658.1 hypothetical protein GCM10010329_50050 [Streptomyces spiroverticillatus]GHD03346.1 hypothetical protein GCM10010334_51000 [Streptomyces finlayi]